MNPIIQWAIPIVVGILTFFGGRAFERHKLAQASRLKLLEPIEEWINGASRLISIIGDDLSAIAIGLAIPIGYSQNERLSTTKSLAENKEKILGILNSKALATSKTNRLSHKLTDLVVQLSISIEQGYLQAHLRILDKNQSGQDISKDMTNILTATASIKAIIQETHSCLSQLKVLFI